MSDRPTSFHDFKWACGHKGQAYCKTCHYEQVDRLTAEVEKVERNAEYHADKNDELVAEVERLREQSHKVVAAWFGEEDNDASLDGLIYELNEISQRSD